MFKFLKNLFKEGQNVNSNPLFEEFNEKPYSPLVNTLAGIISNGKDVTTTAFVGYATAHFQVSVDEETTISFKLSLEVRELEGWVAGILQMYTYHGSDLYEEKYTSLTEEETKYLERIIWDINYADLEDKWSRVRQEMEGTLQLAFNKHLGG